MSLAEYVDAARSDILTVYVSRSCIQDEDHYYLAVRNDYLHQTYVDFAGYCQLFSDPVEGAHELRQRWMPYRLFAGVIRDTPNLITFPDPDLADRFAISFFTRWNEPLVRSRCRGRDWKEELANYAPRNLHLQNDELKKILQSLEASA